MNGWVRCCDFLLKGPQTKVGVHTQLSLISSTTWMRDLRIMRIYRKTWKSCSAHCTTCAYVLYNLIILHTLLTEIQNLKAYIDDTPPHFELIGALRVSRLQPLIFNTPPPEGCKKPEGLRGFIDHHNHATYVAANPDLGLVESKEVDRMLKILDD